MKVESKIQYRVMRIPITDWEETVIMTEEILAHAVIDRTRKRTVMGREVAIVIPGPMRVRDVAQSIGVKTDALFRWLRSGVMPTPKNQRKLKQWCEKYLQKNNNPK